MGVAEKMTKPNWGLGLMGDLYRGLMFNAFNLWGGRQEAVSLRPSAIPLKVLHDG